MARKGRNVNIETRLFGGFETRTEEVNGYTFLHGRAVPYNVPEYIGTFNEVHLPGSFAKTIREAAAALPLLLFHDSKQFPVGRIDKWEDTETGLDGVWKLDSGENAQRAAKLAADGMLTGMSIGFKPIKNRSIKRVEKFDPRLGADYVDTIFRSESKLVEVSLTPTPAFDDARVTLVRSFENTRATRKLEAWSEIVENLRQTR